VKALAQNLSALGRPWPAERCGRYSADFLGGRNPRTSAVFPALSRPWFPHYHRLWYFAQFAPEPQGGDGQRRSI